MKLKIIPATASLGATVSGIRLASLSDAEFVQVEAAFHKHAVLIFPGQHPDDDEQMAFASRFGELSIKAQPFSNEKEDGSLWHPSDPLMQLFKGNEGWHTDSSFQSVAAKASILSARKVPSQGGETEWADMRAAFAALPASTQHRLAGLTAHHSLLHSQESAGQSEVGAREALATLHTQRTAADAQPGYQGEETVPLRPLVKVHPVTGLPALYIGRHAYNVEGLSPSESDTLLRELCVFACRPPRVLRHRWTVGDVVMWDNRCVLHRARPWDMRESRVMFHTRVAGEESERALNTPAADSTHAARSGRS